MVTHSVIGRHSLRRRRSGISCAARCDAGSRSPTLEALVAGAEECGEQSWNTRQGVNKFTRTLLPRIEPPLTSDLAFE